jgi:hypothetical protein
MQRLRLGMAYFEPFCGKFARSSHATRLLRARLFRLSAATPKAASHEARMS